MLVWDIYERTQYRRNKKENEIRIETNFDDVAKIGPFIIGAFLFFGGLAFLYYSDSTNLVSQLLVAIGFLFFVIGFLPIPSGVIKIKKGKLRFKNANNSEAINIEKVKRIEFRKSNILIIEKNHKVHIVNYMNLIEKDYKTIKEFLILKLGNSFEILP